MTTVRAVTALAAAVTVTLLACSAVPPAIAGQRDSPGTAATPQDTVPDDLRARREELQRRREAMRQRAEEMRRAREAVRQGPMVSEPFSRTVRIGRDGSFSLINLSGTVKVAGGGGDDVRIDATKRVWDRTADDAKAHLADVTIDVSERSGTVDVRTVYPRERALDSEVDFTITVPAGSNVSVRTGSGDVSVTGVRGELRAEAVSGAISVSSVGQVRLLRTLSGAVQVDNAESSELTVSTLGGPVSIRRLKARSADVRTVGGDLTLTDSEAERITAQSLSGRVELAGRLARTGRYTLQSQSGDVRLTPIGGDDFELEATAVNGTVRSEFPLTLAERRDTAPSLGGGGRDGRGGRMGRNVRVLRGLSGAGGPLVTMRSFSGDISITRR